MNNEKSNNYQNIIEILSPNYRIIECRNRYQWILQRKSDDADRWRNRSYFLTKSALISECLRLDLQVASLDCLPERFRSRGERGQSREVNCQVSNTKKAQLRRSSQPQAFGFV